MFKPICIINEIIEDAKEKHNELWILFQDMSKVYDDRVNHWSKNDLSYTYPTHILHISVPNMCSIIKYECRKSYTYTTHIVYT
jgi:hypothetical protein